jgi:hypothetical protein
MQTHDSYSFSRLYAIGCWGATTTINKARRIPKPIEYMEPGAFPIGPTSALAVFICNQIDIPSQLPASKVLAACTLLYSPMNNLE